MVSALLGLAGKGPLEMQRAVAAALAEAGCEDAAFDAKILWELAEGDPVKLETLAARRAARVPLQYLAGEWDFLDFTLAVGPGVLCPRADTEVVAETAAACLKGVAAPVVMDLCAGSGCLGLGVKRFCPGAAVTCVELSEDAFRYLTINADKALGPGAVRPVRADICGYEKTLAPQSLDMVLANPPYLTAAEMETLQPEVRQEPAMALRAGEDGLLFYRYIAAQYAPAVKPGGWLVVEIGWQQAQSVCAIFAQNGWEAPEVVRDYGGNNRVVLARRPQNA